MREEIRIEDLMVQSGVKFGTSGARGLVSAMTDRVCGAYALGFAEALLATGRLTRQTPLGIGGDRRPSTPRIMRAVTATLEAAGFAVEQCGLLPSPALALHGFPTDDPQSWSPGATSPLTATG